MQSGATVRPERWIRDDDKDRILTPGAEYNEGHRGWKIVAQTKALREHFGWEMLVSLIAVLISVGGVVAYQSRTNGVTETALNNLAATQKADREEAARQAERQAKIMADQVGRIESQVSQMFELVKQTQVDIRMHGSEIVELRQDTKALWKWGTGLERQIGIIEAELKRK